MRFKLSLFVCAVVALPLMSACTTEGWYEGVKAGAESECRRQPESSTERCLSQLNKQSYDDYEKERTGK